MRPASLVKSKNPILKVLYVLWEALSEEKNRGGGVGLRCSIFKGKVQLIFECVCFRK